MPATKPTANDAHRPLELGLVVLWLAIVVTAFWWFALRDLRPFVQEGSSVSTAALFDADRLPRIQQFLATHASLARESAASLTLLHLRDPACRCNRFSDPHVAALRRDYGSRGVRIETLGVSMTRRDLADWLPATPAALLVDRQGRVLYLGPLSEAANCGRDNAPVERALDDALAGHSAAVGTRLGTGCFCS
jgi:hypothetical protein